MTPKIRNPIITWLLTVLTSGVYVYFWGWLVASELNSAEKRVVFPVTLWRNLLIIFMGLTIVGVVLAIYMDNPFLLIASAVCLFGFYVYVQFYVGNYIKEKDAQLKTGGNFSNTVSVLLFWLVANTGIAYMQSWINRVIRHERERVRS